MRNTLDKLVEKIKTHILCSITFFRKLHRLWDNAEKIVGDRGATNDVTIWRTRVANWISKDICTYAHAHAHAPWYPHARTHARTCKHAHTDQYVIRIAFPQQQWFRELALMLRYTYIACIVKLLGEIVKLRKVTISFVSVRLSVWNNSAPTGRILRNLHIWAFFDNLSRNFKFN